MLINSAIKQDHAKFASCKSVILICLQDIHINVLRASGSRDGFQYVSDFGRAHLSNSTLLFDFRLCRASRRQRTHSLLPIVSDACPQPRFATSQITAAAAAESSCLHHCCVSPSASVALSTLYTNRTCLMIIHPSLQHEHKLVCRSVTVYV